MWPVDQIRAEWLELKPMIAVAPMTFLLLCIALLAIGFVASSWLGLREKKALKAEKDSAEAATTLAEKGRDIYKVEADNYRKKLDEVHAVSAPTQAFPVV